MVKQSEISHPRKARQVDNVQRVGNFISRCTYIYKIPRKFLIITL
jgi:hypothetical protein